MRLELPDGRHIWARVQEPEGPADAGWRPLDGIPQIDELMETIQAVGSTARSALSGLRPDTVSVDFGIELAVKGGKVVSVLTEVGGKASLRITLGWKGEPEPGGPAGEDGDEETTSPG